ncbi:4-hydroxythreonine-4-phosphate dehydrogenase PdxA [Lutimaribacter marinistellae]|uniref:4-hydroxythreonine-4-phosphate dehydrogenase PdxA n=1 Tax=Lutimaribacter marinistellae TaxID=1820329 RepID=A0ABV7TPW3_9RHOB
MNNGPDSNRPLAIKMGAPSGIVLDHGMNIALGLPFLRSSPDHDPAFDSAAPAGPRLQAC